MRNTRLLSSGNVKMQHVRRVPRLFLRSWHVSLPRVTENYLTWLNFPDGPAEWSCIRCKSNRNCRCCFLTPFLITLQFSWLSAVLAPQANGHVAEHHGGEILVYVSRMGRHIRWIKTKIRLAEYLPRRFTEAPKDLIRKLLVVEPNQRISIDDALKHPFFQTVVSIEPLRFPRF